MLHVRGTWNPREDRVPSAIWLGILWAGMIAGFGVDASRFAHENPPAQAILWVHAVVFTGWLMLLTAQVLLVFGAQIAWHRRLGWFMAGWACLMGILRPWAAFAADAVSLNHPFHAQAPQFLSVNFVDIGGFLLLLAWGISLRKNPAAHKRMMILATISLADPGFARFSGHLIPGELQSVFPWFAEAFYGNVLLVFLMLAWDWWHGRLIRSFVLGASALLAAEYIATLLYFWGPWQALTLGWVQAWARHFS
jgi:hypothetical protein